MRILCVGDVVGEAGLRFFCDRIPGLKRETGADYVIVNGENADKSGIGLPRAAAETLLRYADVVTGGNHSLDRAGEELYAEHPALLLPANLPYTDDAMGCCYIDTGRYGTLRVISLSGLAFLDNWDNPFDRVDALLAAGEARFTIVDFHAESSAEKKALAFYLDGRVSAVFGTHTHVQTADEQVLPGGTGFITDAGMTGPLLGVLGMDAAAPIERMHRRRHARFVPADGPMMLNGVLFTLDDDSGLCSGAERIYLRE